MLPSLLTSPSISTWLKTTLAGQKFPSCYSLLETNHYVSVHLGWKSHYSQLSPAPPTPTPTHFSGLHLLQSCFSSLKGYWFSASQSFSTQLGPHPCHTQIGLVTPPILQMCWFLRGPFLNGLMLLLKASVPVFWWMFATIWDIICIFKVIWLHLFPLQEPQDKE